MINPKFIYTVVVMVFIFIVARFKLIPYLAAKKILKDAKQDGTQPPAVSPSVPPQLPASMHTALLPDAVSSGSPAVSPARHEMFFDYVIIDTAGTDSGPVDAGQEAQAIDLQISGFLTGLRKHGICPDRLDILRIDDGLLLAYVTYTV